MTISGDAACPAAMENNPPPDFRPDDDPDNWSAEAASCTLVSPLLHFAQWLGRQPEMVRSGVAGEVVTFLRDDTLFRRLREIDAPADRLIAFCEKAPSDPSPTLRRVFIIRAAMDLLAFQHRATADDWRLHAAQMVKLKALAEANDDQMAVGILTTSPDAVAIRAYLWMKSAASWARLRNSVLGDEALSGWYEIAAWQQE